KKQGAALSKLCGKQRGGLQQLARRSALVPVLEQTHARITQISCDFYFRNGEQRCVQNHVKWWQHQAHRGYFPLVPRSRSIKCVSIFPAANSGSVTIRR